MAIDENTEAQRFSANNRHSVHRYRNLIFLVWTTSTDYYNGLLLWAPVYAAWDFA